MDVADAVGIQSVVSDCSPRVQPGSKRLSDLSSKNLVTDEAFTEKESVENTPIRPDVTSGYATCRESPILKKSPAEPSDGHTTREKDNIQRRLRTFEHWTGPVRALLLAIAGFVYVGPGDSVQCETCQSRVQNWEKNDKPVEVHRKHAPGCSFLKLWFSGSENEATESSPAGPGYSEANAKYRSYITITSRRHSFQGWPLRSKSHSPESMSLAGFFYTGSADRARCFYCGLTLRDWDATDDPFIAHQTYGRNCEYIKNIRRSKEVDLTNVSAVRGPSRSQPEAVKPKGKAVAAAAPGGTQDIGVLGGASVKPRSNNSTQVEAVIAMGFPEEVVMQVFNQRRNTQGDYFPDAVALYCAVEECMEKQASG